MTLVPSVPKEKATIPGTEIVARVRLTFRKHSMTITARVAAPVRRASPFSHQIASSSGEEPGAADLAARWVARRYRLPLRLAAAVAELALLGGSTR